MKIVQLLIFKIICLLYQVWLSAEMLINGFIRYVYIPLFHSLDRKKMIENISFFGKKPEEITLVCDIRTSDTNDILRSVQKISRWIYIVQEGILPSTFNCYLETSFIKDSEKEILKTNLYQILKKDTTNCKIIYSQDFNYSEKISEEKKKKTPLVIVFSGYTSVLGLHPNWLVGAEIAFKPQILRATDYDLYSSLQAFALSEQRKGK